MQDRIQIVSDSLLRSFCLVSSQAEAASPDPTNEDNLHSASKELTESIHALLASLGRCDVCEVCG